LCDFHYEKNVQNARSENAIEARKRLIKQNILY
jgi:hypothetical protein